MQLHILPKDPQLEHPCRSATFRVTQGIEQLSYYDVAGDGLNTHGFCANCGTRLFSRGNIEELGGEFVKVSVAVLDDVPIEALVAAPVTWCDGLHDNWWQPPAEVRHLEHGGFWLFGVTRAPESLDS